MTSERPGRESQSEALGSPEQHRQERATQLGEFNEELARRLATLDCGEQVDPVEARSRLQQRSAQRRKKSARAAMLGLSLDSGRPLPLPSLEPCGS